MTQQRTIQSERGDITAPLALRLALSNPDAFLDWLSGQSGELIPDGEPIATSCPVARYLGAAAGHKVIVYGDGCRLDGEHTTPLPLSDWAIAAVQYTDVLRSWLTHRILRSLMLATLYPEQYS